MNQLQQGNSSHAGLWPWIFFFFYYKHPRHADWIMWRSSSSDAEFRIWLIWASGSLLGPEQKACPEGLSRPAPSLGHLLRSGSTKWPLEAVV